jgi:hypothetical protein
MNAPARDGLGGTEHARPTGNRLVMTTTWAGLSSRFSR